MFALISTFIIIWLVMWGFFKFMYPKPPKEFMPQEGDIITARDCDFCGHPLAEYRGVLEQISPEAFEQFEQDRKRKLQELQSQLQQLPEQTELINAQQAATSRKQKKVATQALAENDKQRQKLEQAIKKQTTWFFCNYEHQAQFHQK